MLSNLPLSLLLPPFTASDSHVLALSLTLSIPFPNITLPSSLSLWCEREAAKIEPKHSHRYWLRESLSLTLSLSFGRKRRIPPFMSKSRGIK